MKWITVGEFEVLADAQLALTALNANEIPCTLVNAALQSVLPMTFTWAPIEIKVPEEYREAALEILPPHSRVLE